MLVNETAMNTIKPDIRDIPATIKTYLNLVIDEQIQDFGEIRWNAEYTFKFWQIENEDELIDFLRFGLSMAVAKIIDEQEAEWQKIHNPLKADCYDEDETDEEYDSRIQRQRALLAKYPPAYTAIFDIFQFYALFGLHHISLVSSWGKAGMADVLAGFQLLGLEQLVAAYTASIEKIPAYPIVEHDNEDENAAFDFMYSMSARQDMFDAFETVMEFNIGQQYADIAEAVRENYELFLV